MAEVLARDPNGLELRADPAALAPERLLVFEVRGALSAFANVAHNVGLELIDEQELEADEHDRGPVAYLMVPDMRALQNLESLWRRWQRGKLDRGETPWRDVFSLLRDLRPWGPQDRVQVTDATILAHQIEGRADDDLIRLEIELVYRASSAAGRFREEEVTNAILDHRGRFVSRARIEEIAYHAVLADLPVAAVRAITERIASGIAALESVMHIRPQSVAQGIEIAEASDGAEAPAAPSLGSPILALLDGVPIAAHRLLAGHLIVDDPFGLEPEATVAERAHGTAMASLIVHGDRNRNEPPLGRSIHVVPVLGAGDAFPPNQLIVDLIHSAIRGMREGADASAPGVIVVSMSLGNRHRPFHGSLSAWARLLDRLAYHYGLLFIVSAGNCLEPFGIEAFETRTAFEDSEHEPRAHGTLRALGAIMADRRLLSPAETVNGLTVGACNVDAVSSSNRQLARTMVDPYGGLLMSNPSSAQGPGFALSVKPDILLPGAREHLRIIRNHTHIEVAPSGASCGAGLRVAAPPSGGHENREGYTNGTSAAAALASRTAHRIHDALEETYGAEFLELSSNQRAVLLKALIAHSARWPDDAATMIRTIIGPLDPKLHARQKDNIRRFLGYGVVDPDDAIACAGDRATFWAVGTLQRNKIAVVDVPVPIAMGGRAQPHALAATLAWFTPTAPGRKSYRSVRLRLVEPQGIENLRVKAHSNQPDSNQTNRGTLFMRCWKGDRAPVVTQDMVIPLTVQRDPDAGSVIDDPVPFGLAVTLTMPGVTEIYEQVRQRLGLRLRPAT